MTNRLIYNTATNVLRFAIRILVVFIMTPLIVHSLGNYDYGIWEVLIAITGYLGVLDLGLRPSITRYVARYAAKKNNYELQLVYNTSFFFMLGIGCLLFLFSMAWSLSYPEVLSPDGANVSKYEILLFIFSFQLVTACLGAVLTSYHQGYQRHYLINFINFCFLIPGNLVLYFLLKAGFGILGLMIYTTGRMIVTNIILFVVPYFSKSYGDHRFALRYFSFEMLKCLISFGLKSFVQNVSTSVGNRCGPLIIAYVLGPVAVTFYTIPVNLFTYVRGLTWNITEAFMPYFSERHASDQEKKPVAFYLFVSKFSIGIIWPVLLGIFFYGSEFISWWLGEEYAEKGWLMIKILTFYGIIDFFNPYDSRYLTAIGKNKILAKVGFLKMVLVVVSTLILVNYIGKEGAAYGLLIGSLVAMPLVLYYVCLNLDINVWIYIKRVILPLSLPLIFFIAIIQIIPYAIQKNYPMQFFIIPASSYIVYLGLLFFLSMTTYERNKFLSQLKISLQAIWNKRAMKFT